ncbi:MAG: GntR family transcriptional regulator, partial [Planctomycetes bacterium]|nr:GntR family transcriptional regulator [Planctomycetota bacterium]
MRIEPSSSIPIYRQIIDQIKYQVATGVLKEGDKVPSVRELAGRLAINQNTVLKVYNELCRQNVLKIERGDGPNPVRHKDCGVLYGGRIAQYYFSQI